MSETGTHAESNELLSSDDVARMSHASRTRSLKKRRSIPRTHRGSFCLAFPLVACHLHSA